jgi:hypothetical protein
LLLLGGWVAAVAVIAGVATLGGGGGDKSVPSDRTVPSPAGQALIGERSIRIDEPARQDDVVRTREIVVHGDVTTGVSRVWVTLESGGRPISSRSIDPMRLPGNDLLPFETHFTLERPRPSGPLFVIVVAIGAGGVPIDALRRRFTLGESVEPAVPVPNVVATD